MAKLSTTTVIRTPSSGSTPSVLIANTQARQPSSSVIMRMAKLRNDDLSVHRFMNQPMSVRRK